MSRVRHAKPKSPFAIHNKEKKNCRPLDRNHQASLPSPYLLNTRRSHNDTIPLFVPALVMRMPVLLLALLVLFHFATEMAIAARHWRNFLRRRARHIFLASVFAMPFFRGSHAGDVGGRQWVGGVALGSWRDELRFRRLGGDGGVV